jgi:hypothetical protein
MGGLRASLRLTARSVGARFNTDSQEKTEFIAEGAVVKSGYNQGTIRTDIGYLVVPKDVRRHRLISISYINLLRRHGRGREFESRRPRHIFQILSLASHYKPLNIR